MVKIDRKNLSPININKPYFTVNSKLAKQIRTTKSYWNKIVNVKHPKLQGKERQVKQVLKQPDEIRQSKSDRQVFLYYRRQNKHHLCVVVKHLNSEGYILTAYLTSKKLEGTIIWIKK